MIWVPPKRALALPRHLRASPEKQRGFLLNPFRFGGSGDPNFSSVVSLLHMDGTDGSTTFTDQTGKTWTAGGNGQLDTAEKQFGTASYLSDGSGDFASTPNSSDWNFGSSAFTVECWARRNSTFVVDNGLVGWTDGTNNYNWVLSVVGSNYRGAFYFVDTLGNQTFAQGPAGEVITTTGFKHVAAYRISNTIYVAVNGVVASTALTGSVQTTAYTLRIGRWQSQTWNGWIDEIRVTKGVARYGASNFTPPSAAFPDS